MYYNECNEVCVRYRIFDLEIFTREAQKQNSLLSLALFNFPNLHTEEHGGLNRLISITSSLSVILNMYKIDFYRVI